MNVKGGADLEHMRDVMRADLQRHGFDHNQLLLLLLSGTDMSVAVAIHQAR